MNGRPLIFPLYSDASAPPRALPDFTKTASNLNRIITYLYIIMEEGAGGKADEKRDTIYLVFREDDSLRNPWHCHGFFPPY